MKLPRKKSCKKLSRMASAYLPAALSSLSGVRWNLSPFKTAFTLVMAGLPWAIPLVHAQGEAIEEISVTGSRIQTSGMTTPTPVTSVTRIELTKMAPGNLVEGLSQLPIFFGNNSPANTGNFFTTPGVGNMNLRGIGANRTLVLLNGRRMVSSTRLGGTDVGVFPEAMIRNIETVTGGASAAYGTDAVSGVVNFILDTEYEGFAVHTQGGITSRGDNGNGEASASFGTALGDRAHILLSADYFEQQGVFSYEDRDWYKSYGRVTNPTWLANGTGKGPRELVLPNVVSTRSTLGGVIDAPGTSIDRMQFMSDGSYTPFIASATSAINTGTLSQSITNGGSGDYLGADRPTLLPDSARGSFFSYLDYDINESLNVFFQGTYGHSTWTNSNLGGAFQGTTRMTIYQDNVFLPAGIRQAMIAQNIPSVGFNRVGGNTDTAAGAYQETINNTVSGTAGFKGEISDEGLFGSGLMRNWQTDGYVQIGETYHRGRHIGGMRLDRVFAAIDVVAHPVSGAPVCRTTLFNPGSVCVPINLFGAGRASKAAVDYVTGFDPGQQVSTPIFYTDTGFTLGESQQYETEEAKLTLADMRQNMVEISANGQVWEGWGAGAVSMAVGASWREELIKQLSRDPTNPTINPAYFPNTFAASTGIRGVPVGSARTLSGIQFATVPNIKGSFTVTEIFGEVLVPLLTEQPLIQQLNMSAATRWAEYTGSGEVWAYKLGFDWEVNDDLRFRATMSRDVRAASLSERFDRTGGSTAFFDPAFGRAGLDSSLVSGGNPEVSPEKADTLTTGVVYRPSFIEGLSMSLDWYSIEIEDAIGQLGVQLIVDGCFNGATSLCQQIDRDPVTNRITLVRNIFVNINKSTSEGVDFETSYTRELDWFGGGESLQARLFVTHLQESSLTNLGAPKIDFAGEIGFNTRAPLPAWRSTANLSYNRGPLSLFVQQRWVDSGLLDATYRQGIDIDNNSVESAMYTDLRIGYTIDSGDSTLELYANALNVMDEEPPVAASFSTFSGQANQVHPGIHDQIGRRFILGARYQF